MSAISKPAPTQPTPSEEWFRTAFDEDYLRVYPSRDEKSARPEAHAAARWLGMRSGDRILDLCCGAGRHSLVFRERGLDVVSLDLSRPLLDQARVRLGADADLVEGDMRHLPFDQVFDHVTMCFTSLGDLESDEADRGVLVGISRVLRNGGGLLIDLPDRAHTIANLVRRSERDVDGFHIEEERGLFDDGRRVIKKVSIVDPRGKLRQYVESVRLYPPDEIETLLGSANFEMRKIHGDFDGEPYVPGDAPRMLVIARREGR
ncbi:MAG TPA: class I SAM-dependent methyltransferase [Planctomycetes bacterium]|nr:class I SAM-dependent methyltransferase [Planctomycetota bacterium]